MNDKVRILIQNNDKKLSFNCINNNYFINLCHQDLNLKFLHSNTLH